MTCRTLRQGSPEWLEARRDTIGSSDIPIIVGESSFKSAHELAAEKLGLVEPVVDAATQELFDIGHLMQPVLVSIYELKTGRPARNAHGWRTHPDIPWATASLDATAPVRRVVEAKWSNSARWRSGEAVPGDVQAQVQWQMFVTGWEVADVVVLSHGLPRIEEVPRDEGFIEDLLYFAVEFHDRLLLGELPPPDGSESARRTLNRMHPRDDGTMLARTPDLIDLAGRLRAAKAELREAQAVEGTLSNAIRQIVGDASGIEGLLTLRKNRDSQRVNWPAVAQAYRHEIESAGVSDKLEARLDAIVSLHSETVEGARVLRLLAGGEPE
jgi:putative phage-type endonuclease